MASRIKQHHNKIIKLNCNCRFKEIVRDKTLAASILILVDRQISSFCDLNHDLATNDMIFFAETVTQQQTSNNIFCAEILQQQSQLFSLGH